MARALPLVERLARLLVDLARDLQHLHAVRDEVDHLVEARVQVDGREELLLLGDRNVDEARDEVGERARRIDLLHGVGELRRRLRQHLDGGERLLLEVVRTRLDGAVDVLHLGQVLRAGEQEGIAGDEVERAEALLPRTIKWWDPSGVATSRTIVAIVPMRAGLRDPAIRRSHRAAGGGRPCARSSGLPA